MAELRRRLSPQGNVVSEAGRRRTIEVFGEPLSPQQVVERICRDVQQQGVAAVLDYSARIDKAAADGRRRFACRRRNWPRPTPRPIRNCSRRSAAWRRTSASFSRRFCTATCGWSGPAGILSSGIGRWIAWAFACRAGPPRIRRPC